MTEEYECSVTNSLLCLSNDSGSVDDPVWTRVSEGADLGCTAAETIELV